MKIKFIFICTFVLSLFAFEAYSQRPTPNDGWKDSYNANNLCWCDTSFDHDVDNINKVWFVINGVRRNIRDICDELEKHPSYRTLRNGDPIYNDIQCGNGPANTAGDEDPDQCPGRVDKGSAGCTEIGPKWDVAWLSGRSRFGGDGNPTPTPPTNNDAPPIVFQSPSNNASFTAPASITDVTVAPANGNRVGEISNIRLYINNQFIRQENVSKYEWAAGRDAAITNLGNGTYTLRADATAKNGETSTASITITVGNVTPTPPTGDRIVSILARTTNKYTSSSNGLSPMIANRDGLGSWERFTMISEGGDVYGFKSNTGKYVSSEDGNRPMNANRDGLGLWEKFTLVSRGGDVYALRGNNGKYVSHNGGSSPLTCDSDAIGSNEEFIIQNVSGQKLQSANLATSASNIYPNPFKLDGILNLQVQLTESSEALVQAYDIAGKKVYTRELGSLDAGTTIITLEGIQNSLKNAGIYIIQFQAGIYKESMTLVVKK